MNNRTFCQKCRHEIRDHHTVVMEGGLYYHYECRPGPPQSTATLHERLMEPKMNEHDLCPDHWAKASAAAGAKPVFFERTDDPRPIRFPPPTINYHITPSHFRLDIPVEALAGLSPDAHTRMLAMLNNWITEHKPVVVKGPTT